MVTGSQKRLPLMVITACLALAAVSAEVFVFTRLNHDCTGEHCPVCLQLEIAQNLLEGLGRIGLFVLAACFIPLVLVTVRCRLSIAIVPPTLVGLKVKYSC
jgi:hypothetical protein